MIDISDFVFISGFLWDKKIDKFSVVKSSTKVLKSSYYFLDCVVRH